MLKVIVIDDESITREGLVNFVDWEKYGFRVFGEANDGLQGLELAERIQPDLAICDIKMPHMNGIEMASKMKEIAPNCKLVFLSGYSDKEYLKSAIKLNVVDYLEKPINMKEMEDLLRRVRNHYDEESNRVNRNIKLKAKMDKSHQYLLNSIIERILNGQDYEQSTLEILMGHMGLQFPLHGIYKVVVIKAPNIHIESLTSLLKKKKTEEGLTMLIADKNEMLISVHAYEIKMQTLSGFYQDIFNMPEFKDSLEAGLGKKVLAFEDLKESYQDALDAITWQGYKNKNTLIYSDGFDNNISVVREAERYISKNFDQNLSIQDIADEVYLTPQYLCKVFKTATGTTINAHITEMRMERACDLLLDRNLKLYEVAAQVGYRDANYFARVFKRFYGYNPSEYRENHKV
ncbi:response regulator [Erysipelothrix urinaevulpis]|uniref:response regulator transcription factor n=1 Tax=Erysipelothrix urinaevulpis TaxID=2683717 RepID=UPI0013571127|nr:response regulator [Erysipelothrix urinaevulpis]